VPLFVVRALHGVAEGTARVALFTMLFDILPEGRHGEAMTIFSLNGMTPAAVAPMIGEIIMRRLGFTAFFVAAAACCGCGALAMTLVSDRLGVRPAGRAAGERGPRWSALLLDRGLVPIWIATLLFSAALASRLNFVTPFGVQRHVAFVAIYFVVYSAAAILVRLFCGRLVEATREERILAPSLIALGIGIALLSLTGRHGILSIAGVIGGLGHGFTYPALTLLVLRRTPERAMGETSTIYTSLFDVAAMAAPYLLGLVASGAGYAPMFVIAGACAIGAGLYVTVAEDVFSRRAAE
jgi:predicted MFS family arabinose efflux permease